MLRGIAVCWSCGSIYWCCGGLPSVGAVVLSTGAAGGCRLLVLCVYLLVLRGLPSVGPVVLSTGAVGLPAVDAVGVWSNWLHLTTSSAV